MQLFTPRFFRQAYLTLIELQLARSLEPKPQTMSRRCLRVARRCNLQRLRRSPYLGGAESSLVWDPEVSDRDAVVDLVCPAL